MDTQVKERKLTQRRTRTETGPIVNPDGVSDTLVEQQTDHAMKRMAKVLKSRQKTGEAVKVNRLVSNPDSFAQFVENAFTLSFLVKDGEAGLLPSAGGANVVKKHKPEEEQVDRSTFVLHLDMKGWRALTQRDGGAVGLMPHREENIEEKEVVEMEGARGPSVGAPTGIGGGGGAGAARSSAGGASGSGSGSGSGRGVSIGAEAGARARTGAAPRDDENPTSAKAKGKKIGKGLVRPRELTNSQEREEQSTKQRRRT